MSFSIFTSIMSLVDLMLSSKSLEVIIPIGTLFLVYSIYRGLRYRSAKDVKLVVKICKYVLDSQKEFNTNAFTKEFEDVERDTLERTIKILKKIGFLDENNLYHIVKDGRPVLVAKSLIDKK